MSLESARSPDPEDDESLVNFLAVRLSSRSVDLVALFGDPAMRFAARHRQRLFPDVPLLISGVEQRGLPPVPRPEDGRGRRLATIVTMIVEDILQVLPATRQIVVVFGVSRLGAILEAMRPSRVARFENRVQFRWLEGLPVEAMKREVASLPSELRGPLRHAAPRRRRVVIRTGAGS